MSKKVIVFQGDSVTDCGRCREDAKPNACLGDGYAFITAARLLAEKPQAGLEFYNRGVSGNRCVDLYARWKADTLNLEPGIVSILIGVNDTWHEYACRNGVEVERYATVCRMLLEWTLQARPAVRLMLIEPFVLPFGEVESRWIPEMDRRREIIRSLAREFHTGFVPAQEILTEAAQKALPEHYLQDGVHPTPAGHHLLADAWIREAERIGFWK